MTSAQETEQVYS